MVIELSCRVSHLMRKTQDDDVMIHTLPYPIKRIHICV